MESDDRLRQRRVLEDAGLAGPHSDPRRRQLVEHLVERGFTADEIIAGQASITGLLGDRLLRVPGPRHTIAEAAQRLEMEPELVRRVWRSTGLPDPGERAALSDHDIVNIHKFLAAAEMFGLDPIVQFQRVIGASLARIAEAAVALFMSEREQPLMEGGGSMVDLAQANEMAVAALLEVPEIMETLFRHHMEAAIAHFRAGRGGPETYHTLRTAVLFVDLVGSTELSRRLGARTFSGSIADFEQIVSEAATDHDGRLVKLIGDEAMVVCLERTGAVDIARAVRAAVDDHPGLGRCRGGVAFGEPAAQHGDYFGPVVNLASRLATAAQPGQILVDAATADAVGATAVGDRELAGFDEPVPVFEVD